MSNSNQHNDSINEKPFLYVSGQPIYFQEDWGTGIGGGLWSTGAALAKYFDTAHAAQQLQKLSSTSASSSFLELGSGNGLLSVCWMAHLLQQQQQQRDKTTATTFPRQQPQHKVVVTDTAEHLALMRKTLDGNPHIVQNQQLDVHVLEHLWGEFDNDINNHMANTKLLLGDHQTFDYIVGSDVAYRRELYEPLITSLQHFSNHKTIILLGCTMADTKPKFFDLLRRAGFTYRRLADHVLPQDYRGQETFGIFVLQRQ